MNTGTKLVPIHCEFDASVYVKLLKRAEKSGLNVRGYISSRFASFFNPVEVCNTQPKAERDNIL